MYILAQSLLRSPRGCPTPRALSTRRLQVGTLHLARKYSSNGSTDPPRRCARVPNRALVAVTGSQASTFLNGIITVPIPAPDADIWKINGGGIYSAFLSAPGRIMYDIFIYPYIPKSPEEKSGYIVEYDPRAASAEQTSTSAQQPSAKHSTPTLISMLKRYILRSKVRVRDVSENWDVWAMWGSSLPQSIKDIARPDDWRWGRSGAVEPIYHDAERTPVDRAEVQNWILGQDSPSGPAGTDTIWMVDRRAPGMGIRALVPKGVKPNTSDGITSSDEYTLHRIKLGVPEGVDDIPPQDSFPMDANMDMMGGVDFRKGCYVGQELTVRTYHTGVIRKRVVPVLLDSQSQETSSSSGETTSADPSRSVAPPPQTAVQASWLPESPRPRPRAPGKLLTSTPDGYALALLRLEALKAAESGEMRLFVTGADNQPISLLPRRPEWWPSETKEEEWTE